MLEGRSAARFRAGSFRHRQGGALAFHRWLQGGAREEMLPRPRTFLSRHRQGGALAFFPQLLDGAPEFFPETGRSAREFSLAPFCGRVWRLAAAAFSTSSLASSTLSLGRSSLRLSRKEAFKGHRSQENGRDDAGEHSPPSGPTLKGADPRTR